MENKEILFTTETTLTYDEYVRFSNRACRFSNALSYVLWIGIAGALCVLAIRSGKYEHALVVALVCAIKVIQGPIVKRKKQKEAFQDKESAGNCYLVYDFYEDCFVMTCNMLPGEPIRYYDLLKIIETKTNFYLIYAFREGCVIIKQNCSPELIRFLHQIKEDPKGPLYREDAVAKLEYSQDDRIPEIAKRFGFSYEIINWDTPPEEVVKRYQQALRLAAVDGYPVIFPNNSEVLEAIEALEETDRQELLHQELPDGKQLLQSWCELLPLDEIFEEDFMGGRICGDGSPQDTFIGVEVLRQVLKNDELVLLKIPVDAPWKTLAYFPLSDKEDCPAISEIMSVGKYWYEKYRAVPAVFGCDMLEFLADESIMPEQDAWQLAKEQMGFCDNALDLGTNSETIGELVDNLMKTQTWYFLWTW